MAAVLAVAGDGPLGGRLERRGREQRCRWTFTGLTAGRPTSPALLASADVVIGPGPVETFGLAALEALACGTPVAASRSRALPDPGRHGRGGGRRRHRPRFRGRRPAACWTRPEAQRRAQARARAEQYGWPAAVHGFLAAHAVAARVETPEETVQMTTFTALGDSITLGLGDPAAGTGGWRGWAVFLAEGLPGGQLHNLATTGAQAADVERGAAAARARAAPGRGERGGGDQRHACGAASTRRASMTRWRT